MFSLFLFSVCVRYLNLHFPVFFYLSLLVHIYVLKCMKGMNKKGLGQRTNKHVDTHRTDPCRAMPHPESNTNLQTQPELPEYTQLML